MAEPVFRRGVWWQQQDDGTWLRWNEGTSSWEPSMAPPPPEDAPAFPPAPPMPGAGMPGQYGSPMGQRPVDSYLVWAILVTLFCFLPTGIVAIVYSSQVSSKLAAGDYAGAVQSSNKAKTWSIVSAVIGVVFILGLVAIGSSTGTDFSVYS
ncbi:MAG TPA: CD225/dispanin family protein [Actinomycetota bacterium]|nr:CD225/dispanin family protein [Actinomycetota bacterium]